MTINSNVNKVYVIAEAGVNHNGDLQQAFKLIDVAVKASADAIKFQSFKANNVASFAAQKADYQKKTTSKFQSHLEMLKNLELNEDDFFKINDYCKNKNIDLIVSAFDHDSLQFITDKLGVSILKIPSGEITNGPFLLTHSLKGLDIILSTGMSTLNEIKLALSILAFGFVNSNNNKIKPSLKNFKKAYNSFLGKKLLKEKVTILHCTSEYPAPIVDINLNAMINIRDSYNLSVGYSDHSEGYLVSIVAASMGAKIIEKHFTSDKNMKGPDHKASLNPKELKTMIEMIRKIEIIKGSSNKELYKSEQKNVSIVRKSLVAKNKIRSGEIFSSNNITFKRPFNGKSPMEYWQMIGTRAEKDYEEDEPI